MVGNLKIITHATTKIGTPLFYPSTLASPMQGPEQREGFVVWMYEVLHYPPGLGPARVWQSAIVQE